MTQLFKSTMNQKDLSSADTWTMVVNKNRRQILLKQKQSKFSETKTEMIVIEKPVKIIQCNYCHQEGHVNKECPILQRKVCKTCGFMGHTASRCTNPSRKTMAKKLYCSLSEKEQNSVNLLHEQQRLQNPKYIALQKRLAEEKEKEEYEKRFQLFKEECNAKGRFYWELSEDTEFDDDNAREYRREEAKLQEEYRKEDEYRQMEKEIKEEHEKRDEYVKNILAYNDEQIKSWLDQVFSQKEIIPNQLYFAREFHNFAFKLSKFKKGRKLVKEIQIEELDDNEAFWRMWH